MIKIALLGCGRIGRMHAANLASHPRVELGMVYDLIPEAAEGVGADLGVRVAGGIDDVLGSPDIDAVLIATATPTHADYIEACVDAGKPAFCEKPIDLDLSRVNLCAEHIEGKNVPIQIGFNRRFDPGHKSAHEAALSGEIGELHQVVITSRDPALPPRDYLESAGGLFRDMTIHDFDLARFMLGSEPTEVVAFGNALIDPELGAELDEIDTAMILLRSESGAQCHINNSRTAVYGYDQRVELLGEKGMIVSGNRKPNEVRKFSADAVEVAPPYFHFFIERYHEAFMAEIDAFVDCVSNHTEPAVGFDDGRRALVLAEAAYKSMTEGRTVRVDEIEPNG